MKLNSNYILELNRIEVQNHQFYITILEHAIHIRNHLFMYLTGTTIQIKKLTFHKSSGTAFKDGPAGHAEPDLTYLLSMFL